MKNNKKRYIVVAGSETELVAINPIYKDQVMTLKPENNIERILDVQILKSSIYYASEIVRSVKSEEDPEKYYPINFVAVYNALKNKDILEIEPPEFYNKPKDKRYFQLDFKFKMEGRAFGCILNKKYIKILSNSVKIPEIKTLKLVGEGKQIIFNGLRIATLDDKVDYLYAVPRRDFLRMFRKNNQSRYNKLKKGILK